MKSILEKFGFIKNLGMGEVQSDEEMTVVPLVGDCLGDMAPPEFLKFERTTTYGSMEYKNNSDKPAIVPTNMMVRGSNAQDHAMAGSGVVLPSSREVFRNACCIESDQGGYFDGQPVEEDVLPIDLRKRLLESSIRSKTSYDKLWGFIREWLQDLEHVKSRSYHRAHLRDFYDQPTYKTELESFAASFEPIDGQIGALILFNGVPVGLEIMPSHDHWLAYWKWLIRGCYGSELIRLKDMNRIPSSKLVLPDIPVGAGGAEVKEVLTKFLTKFKMSIGPMLESINIKKATQIDSKDNIITTLVRTENNGGGDVIIQNSKPVYLSIVL